ncbi:MAG: apolipoprotein N-acyltransferase [Gammaproteobacteria bacterium]
MLTFAFAPYDYSFFALISLAFFYLFCTAQSIERTFFTGYLFGLGLFGSGIWWVYISIHDFGGADPLSSISLVLLLVCAWSIFPALTAVLAKKFCLKLGIYARVAGFALIWVVIEYFRGYWLLNGFPWLQIGYSQLDTPLAGYVPVVGVYGVGFFLAVSASLLVEIGRKNLILFPGIIIVFLLWGGGYLLRDVQWTKADGKPIAVTLIQGNIAQGQKWLPGQKLKTLKLYQELTEQHWDSDVIIWPETAIPAFLNQVQDFYLEPLAQQARTHGVDLVVSLPTNGEGRNYYNSVLNLSDFQSLYHKNHLLPFGEYLPLQPLSGWILERLQIPLGNFAAGSDRQPLLKAGGHPFVATICYEDAFGELVNRQVADAAYLVNVTNDAWFGRTSEPYQHMQMARMRALETGRHMVRATNTGLTGFVLPNGKLSKQAPLFETTTLTDTVVPMTGLTPYARWGDKAVFIGLFALVIVLQSVVLLVERRSFKLSVARCD